MKPCLKVKSNKCFGQIQTNDEVKLAKMCQLFMKVSLDLELGPRLENAALRFNHIQRRISSNNTPRAAAGHFSRVTKAAAERLETFRKSDLIQFSKSRRPTKKEDTHEDSKLQCTSNGVQAPEAPCSLTETEGIQEKMAEEIQPFTSHIHDNPGWEVQEVAPLTEAAIPFLGGWDQVYQDSSCWDWQGYSAPYMDQYMDGYYQELQQGPFQEIIDLIPPHPRLPHRVYTPRHFFCFERTTHFSIPCFRNPTLD
ncbi:hypothetical protein DSO57_1032462 [Entomophthora muscae]|uniref:Uncharacterized protein n=1 Tax=Entomophthora muscae TaxID=34485 RepID=A0ACC2TMS2_9FUNG|nr:hypothetical protein DSO57_1032462 [Entomophthora muscae]